MLTTVERVLRVVGMSNPAQLPVPWLNDLVGDADAGIKRFLKRDIELTAYVEYHSGDNQREVICGQWPVLQAQTTIAAASGGQSLPQSVINVASTLGFHPGLGLGPTASPAATVVPPSIAIQTGTSTWTSVTYTGTTTTSFTGCVGGTGALSTGNGVATPCLWFDPGGYYGQAPQGFAPGTQLVQGTQFVVVLDKGGGGTGGASVGGSNTGRKSARGLIRRIGGSGQGFVGFYPEILYSGKLGAYRLPAWPRGDGNIKLAYSAGYAPYEIPLDIVNAATQLVAYLVRNMPTGAPLQSESLGAYSYSVMTQSTDVPEIGSIVSMLRPHREVSL